MITREQARKQWIEALKSGKYPQTEGRLRTKGGYCCLGVACELFTNELQLTRGWIIDRESFDGETAQLPLKVKDLLGLRSYLGSGKYTYNSLAHLNDEGKSFLQIAEALETGDYWEEA